MNANLKSGRWTYAEQRRLIGGLKAGKSVEAIAHELRRSASSARRKAVELGLGGPPSTLSKTRTAAITEAARRRLLSTRCKELSSIAGEPELTMRLNAMAVEYQEEAWAIEARAGLPLTRESPEKTQQTLESKTTG